MNIKQILFRIISVICAVSCVSCAAVTKPSVDSDLDDTAAASAAFLKDYEAYQAKRMPKPAKPQVTAVPQVTAAPLAKKQVKAVPVSIVPVATIKPVQQQPKIVQPVIVKPIVKPSEPIIAQTVTIKVVKQSQVVKQIQPKLLQQPKLMQNKPISIQSPIQPQVQPKAWLIDVDDKVISATITKWAASEGYTLIWDSRSDFQIQTPSVLHGSLKGAINQVLKSFKNTGNPLRANWYTNKVVKITSAGNTASIDNTTSDN
jgi:hypothetical protein